MNFIFLFLRKSVSLQVAQKTSVHASIIYLQEKSK